MKHLFISEWAGFTLGFYFPLSSVKFQPQIEMKKLIIHALISAEWYCQLVIHSLRGNGGSNLQMHEKEQLIPGRYVSKFISGRQRRCCFVEVDSSLPRNLITQ